MATASPFALPFYGYSTSRNTRPSPPRPPAIVLAAANKQGLEAYGLYKIGEILGRRHLIGYNVPANAVGQH